ncbi:hypothetical protein OSTOST_06040 [Ostertagia ostertagi]
MSEGSRRSRNTPRGNRGYRHNSRSRAQGYGGPYDKKVNNQQRYRDTDKNPSVHFLPKHLQRVNPWENEEASSDFDREDVYEDRSSYEEASNIDVIRLKKKGMILMAPSPTTPILIVLLTIVTPMTAAIVIVTSSAIVTKCVIGVGLAHGHVVLVARGTQRVWVVAIIVDANQRHNGMEKPNVMHVDERAPWSVRMNVTLPDAERERQHYMADRSPRSPRYENRRPFEIFQVMRTTIVNTVDIIVNHVVDSNLIMRAE